MSVMGFQKKFGWGWVGSIQVFFGFLDFFNFAKPLKSETEKEKAGLVKSEKIKNGISNNHF